MPGSVLHTLHVLSHNRNNADKHYYTQFTEEQTDFEGKGTTQDHSTKVVELFKETNFRACVLCYQLWGYVFTLEIMGQLAISSIRILILYPSILLYLSIK